MARAASIPLVRTAGLYSWLIDRERQALDAGGVLPWTPDQPAYTGIPERLEALQAGEPVDMPAGDLPPYARAGRRCRWRDRAVVDADGGVEFYTDDGSAWLRENGL
jgi:hypothetical protein